MGQQQLLLIVLGVILVGIAVVLGIQYFGVGAEQGAKDELVAHSQIIGANAQEWFKKPVSMGGGGLTFANYNLEFNDHQAGLHSSTNGDYTVGTGTAASVAITGTPKAALNYTWHVTCTVYPSTMATVIQ